MISLKHFWPWKRIAELESQLRDSKSSEQFARQAHEKVFEQLARLQMKHEEIQLEHAASRDGMRKMAEIFVRRGFDRTRLLVIFFLLFSVSAFAQPIQRHLFTTNPPPLLSSITGPIVTTNGAGVPTLSYNIGGLSNYPASAVVSGGTLQAATIGAFSGDITTPGGSYVTTLATVNGSPGAFGDGTHVAKVTVNGKGLSTAVSSIAIDYTPATNAIFAQALWTNDTLTPAFGTTVQPNNGTFYVGPVGGQSMTNEVYSLNIVADTSTGIGGTPGADAMTVGYAYVGSNQAPAAMVVTILPRGGAGFGLGAISESATYASFYANKTASADNGGMLYGLDSAFGAIGESVVLTTNSGGSVGFVGFANSKSWKQAGVSGVAFSTQNNQHSIGTSGVGIKNSRTGGATMGLFAGIVSNNALDPAINTDYQDAAANFDNFTLAAPLGSFWHNSAKVGEVDGTGNAHFQQVVSTNNVFIVGTTNQIIFGATNTAPASTASPTKWVSVQVSGESTVYRLPLYQ